MESVFNFLGFSRPDREVRHYEASDDTILPISQANHNEADDAYDQISYEEEGSNDSEEMLAQTDPYYASADQDTRLWIDRIVTACQDRYQEPQAMVSLVYKTFCEQYPSLETLNPDALEYIRDRSEYDSRETKHGSFPCILYSNLITTQEVRPQACIPVPNVNGVFLVNLQHDYVYGRVIECALLKRDPFLSQRALELFNQRRSLVRPCPRNHIMEEKVCPAEWMLYVSQTSEFYDYCCKQLKRDNPLVDHNVTPDYVNAEFLSFYLVLFLCGEYLERVQDQQESKNEIDLGLVPTAYYADVNQWKKLPIWFLDVWYAGHPADK